MLAGRLTLVLSLVLSLAAQGASFDCSKANSDIEKFVCSNAALSAEDEALDEAYKSRMASLSDAGKVALRDGQRSWLKYLQEVCSEPATVADEKQNCLRKEYGYRQKQIINLSSSDRGFSFLTIEKFHAERPKTNSSPDSYLVTTHIAYPQIALPKGKAEAAWNAFVKAQVDNRARTGADTDMDINCHVKVSGPRAVTIAIERYVYPHGAAHGNSSTVIFTRLLDYGRDLRAEDIFDNQKNWNEMLAHESFRWLMAQNQAAQRHFDVESVAGLRKMSADTYRWSFLPQGFAIQFNTYEVGPYAAGAPQVVIPWERVKPFLVKEIPIFISE